MRVRIVAESDSQLAIDIPAVQNCHQRKWGLATSLLVNVYAAKQGI